MMFIIYAGREITFWKTFLFQLVPYAVLVYVGPSAKCHSVATQFWNKKT